MHTQYPDFIPQVLFVTVYSGRRNDSGSTFLYLSVSLSMQSNERIRSCWINIFCEFLQCGDLGRQELFQPAFCADTQLSCKIYIENGFNKPYWLKTGVTQWNWEKLSAVGPVSALGQQSEKAGLVTLLMHTVPKGSPLLWISGTKVSCI